MNFNFQLAQAGDFNLTMREGETRLWQDFHFGEPNAETLYIILGISEDHGPQLNKGLSGAHLGFKNCIEKFCHMQSNLFLNGKNICVLGEIMQSTAFNKEQNDIEELDELVEKTLSTYLQPHHKLIVIGGGHNNALPLIRYNAANKGPVHCMNIDPHADLRETSERHSGNPFSFAYNEGTLSRYHVVGLHESYNNSFILDFFQKAGLSYQTFEDYLDSSVDFWVTLEKHLNGMGTEIQLDIDLDSIPHMPSSAWTPSGFHLDQVRSILRYIGKQKNIHTLHLPEGAPSNEEEMKFYSKGVSYLIADFIKTQN